MCDPSSPPSDKLLASPPTPPTLAGVLEVVTNFFQNGDLGLEIKEASDFLSGKQANLLEKEAVVKNAIAEADVARLVFANASTGDKSAAGAALLAKENAVLLAEANVRNTKAEILVLSSLKKDLLEKRFFEVVAIKKLVDIEEFSIQDKIVSTYKLTYAKKLELELDKLSDIITNRKSLPIQEVIGKAIFEGVNAGLTLDKLVRNVLTVNDTTDKFLDLVKNNSKNIFK